MRKALVLGVVGCLGVMGAARQANPQATAVGIAAPADARAQIDAQVAEWLKESDVPSVAVAYVKDGKVAWTAVYGEQSPGVAATEKTLYNMASLTKPDIKDDPWTPLLTPRLCLSHQTGFANWRRMTGGVLKMRWQPCTQTGYSGEGYNYVGRFTEKKMGKPFDALAEEMVLNPIGMRDTSYTAQE